MVADARTIRRTERVAVCGTEVGRARVVSDCGGLELFVPFLAFDRLDFRPEPGQPFDLTFDLDFSPSMELGVIYSGVRLVGVSVPPREG